MYAEPWMPIARVSPGRRTPQLGQIVRLSHEEAVVCARSRRTEGA